MKKIRKSRKKEIALLLQKALIDGGKMVRALYEHELEEHLDYWYRGLKADKNDFVFVTTENRGDVAMVLIMPDKTVYINEDGRAKLAEFWPQTYDTNLKRLIPGMADDLANDNFAVHGITIISNL